MEKHVYLVRHGQSTSNADRIYRGREAELTDEGRAQARAVAERIKRIGVDALITSSYPRARDTASEIERATGLSAETDTVFEEWTEPSYFMGKHESHPEAKSLVAAIVNSLPEVRHHDEETFVEFIARAEAALIALEQHPAERICVVSHAGFIKALAGLIVFRESFTKNMFYAMFDRLKVSNTGVTYIRKASEEHPWGLVTWNDISHFG